MQRAVAAEIESQQIERHDGFSWAACLPSKSHVAVRWKAGAAERGRVVRGRKDGDQSAKRVRLIESDGHFREKKPCSVPTTEQPDGSSTVYRFHASLIPVTRCLTPRPTCPTRYHS